MKELKAEMPSGWQIQASSRRSSRTVFANRNKGGESAMKKLIISDEEQVEKPKERAFSPDSQSVQVVMPLTRHPRQFRNPRQIGATKPREVLYKASKIETATRFFVGQ